MVAVIAWAIDARGANVYYNSSTGSDCFITVGYGHVFALGHGCDSKDGLLQLGQRTSTSGGYTYHPRTWAEAEAMHIGAYAQKTYTLIGIYAFFRAGSSDSVYSKIGTMTCNVL